MAPTAEKRGRYLLFYDAETTAAFDSPIYYARLGHPSSLSRAIVPRFRNTWRTVCTVEQRWGEGIGSAALTLRAPYGRLVPFDEMAALQPARVDLLTGQPSMGQANTTEKELRREPDRQIEQALIAFFWSMDAAEAARDKFAPSAELFSLQHSMSADDLPPDHP
jgi:hypothetical protein